MAKITLSAVNYQNLLNAERNLTDVLAEMDKAEKCGIDCQNYREIQRRQLTEIANMKANFAPRME